ncbi:Tubulin gamma-2 chain [Clonorchis sinensis]|uniref:Tubulin gamma-2 chain n=1 Tax=Clonorchis sinensis TaxID=79923 RepID=A0A8T1M524_CLOSI|nr:Tubulin gamma-2 chain [Clonorchis sinensis]
MSIVYLGVGQCGTQLLSSFLAQNLNDRRASSYLLDDINQFRGLLVDAEPKPINRILENSCLKLDYCIGLCLVHSLAGGTGSGLGLRLAEDAVEELDLCLRLTFSVTPHRYGDAPLQSYNSLLTLGRLTQFSESVVLLQNDWLLTQLNCRLPRNRAASSRPTTDSSVMAQMGITVDEMNRLAAEQMMNLLAPCDELARDGDTVQADGVRPVHAEPLALNHSLTALSEARFIRVISETARSLNSKKSSR